MKYVTLALAALLLPARARPWLLALLLPIAGAANLACRDRCVRHVAISSACARLP